MDFTFESIMGFIRAKLFYDFRSTVLTVCFLLVMFFFFKLLKYNNEKPIVSLKYIVVVVVCGAVFLLMY